jgi:hypothetical protein
LTRGKIPQVGGFVGSEDPQEKSLKAATRRARPTLLRSRVLCAHGTAARAALVAVAALLLAGSVSPAALGLASPTVTAVAPNSGPESGETSVTITGTGFTGATEVRFGLAAAKSFEVVSETSIKATSPASAPGKVHVTVTTEGGTSTTTAADEFTYVPKPTVETVLPNEGSEAGGTSVTITGTNLTGATAVKFGATKASSFKVESATSIVATSPARTGTVDVTVTTAGGTSAISAADHFSFVPPPTVTNVEPSEGPEAGGTSVTITGTNLTGATAVKFGTTEVASFKVESATSIVATSPAGVGTVDVTVTTAGGTSATGEADRFTYIAPPEVTAVEPRTGPSAGATSVTITGTNLTGATAVKFGATNASSFKVESATSIVATSPAGSGVVDVTVTTPGGTSATGAADAFTYLTPATEGPPKPKETETPPPPAPVANCTLKPIFLTLERKRKGKTKPRVVGGALQVTVTCDQSASVRLAGRLGLVGKKPGHGKARTKVYALGPSSATVSKGVPKPVTLRLPLATIHALIAKARESVRITLAATDSGGTTHNAVRIKQLRV